MEEYLRDLEKRQELEKAPCAAVFMLGSEEMLKVQYGGHPWLMRVRCELPTRPLGPGGEEEPVRATYISADSEADAQRYQTFVDAMKTIDVHRCAHLKLAAPSARALAHLEESDIVALGDGPHVDKTWHLLEHGDECVLERFKWRYYSGAVLLGIGSGGQFVSERWWVGNPKEELESNAALGAGEPDPHKHAPTEGRYIGGKATAIVPWMVTSVDEHAEAIAELLGFGSMAVVLPRRGAVIFNTDGALEPCGSMLVEYKNDYKRGGVQMGMLVIASECFRLLLSAFDGF